MDLMGCNVKELWQLCGFSKAKGYFSAPRFAASFLLPAES